MNEITTHGRSSVNDETNEATDDSVNHPKGQLTLECEQCGLKVFEQWDGREEMELHEAECDGTDDSHERFEEGDRVQYSGTNHVAFVPRSSVSTAETLHSDYGLKRLGYDQREGELVGWSRSDPHCVRVRWDGRKSPMKLAHQFVKHVE